MFKSIVFIFIGFVCIVNSARLHFKYKKRKMNFLDDAPGAPLYFYFLVFGIFFIIIGIMTLPNTF